MRELSYAAMKSIKFEEQIVCYLLQRYGLSKYRLALIDQHELVTGERQLTLHDFGIMFPTFPVALETGWTHERNPPLSRIFKKFESLRIVLNFRLDDRFPREPVTHGLVFFCQYLKIGAGALVVHNGPLATMVPGTRLQHITKDGRSLTIETLTTLLDRVDAAYASGHWEPTATNDR